jgi:ribose 5-phosphate isomerase RpiB
MSFFEETVWRCGTGKGAQLRKNKEEIPAIKSRCAEFGTLICGSGM